jgi:hypothetical protein
VALATLDADWFGMPIAWRPVTLNLSSPQRWFNTSTALIVERTYHHPKLQGRAAVLLLAEPFVIATAPGLTQRDNNPIRKLNL